MRENTMQPTAGSGKKRSGFKVMAQLIGLVKPLSGYMCLAIVAGVLGHLCAAFITILGGYAVLAVLGLQQKITLQQVFIAVPLLALIRDKVFMALRRLCPAKLEGRGKGDLISVITSDIELLEVFYAHTISPTAIAFVFILILCGFIGSFHPALGLLALAAYVTVGIFVPLAISKASGDHGMKFRNGSGELSGYVLDSLRGLQETIQYGQGRMRLDGMMEKTDALSAEEKKMKAVSGRNTAITNTVILLFDLAMLCVSVLLYRNHAVGYDGVLIPTIALMSSFGPCVALAALGSTLQNTFAAGNRVLDILEEQPVVEEITGKPEIAFHGAAAGHKVDALQVDDKVCFTVYGNETIKEEETWAPYLQSTVVFGRCKILEDQDMTLELVRKVAEKYYPNETLIDEEIADHGKAVRIYEITIEHISGKEIQEK